MIVMKFGGTSMGSAASIKDNVCAIVRREFSAGRSPFVVVSAMSGVTSELVAASALAVQRRPEECRLKIQDIQFRHVQALKDMITDSSILETAQEEIERELTQLAVFLDAVSVVGELSMRSHDIVIAVGEKLAAQVLCSVLTDLGIGSTYVNLESVITGDLTYDSPAYWDQVQDQFKARLEWLPRDKVPVLTGFFGPTDKGILQSVGRGYSDFCASILGAALKADEIQIWTDVDGVLSTNPVVVEEAFLLPRISFDEMGELAHFGAKVLHPHSVRPAFRANIPIRILNTFHPQCPGTLVVSGKTEDSGPFKAIAYKKGVTILRVETARMLMAYGFMARISDLFAKHKVSIDLIATSEVSVSMSVDENPVQLKALIRDLGEVGEVSTQSQQSIVSIVGTEMQNGLTIHGRLFDALNRAQIPIHLISMGNALINLSLVVDDQHCEQAVRLLHQVFFEIKSGHGTCPDPAAGGQKAIGNVAGGKS